MTLTEMLVVLAILVIVLGGMTTLFVSASTSHIDQSNRVAGAAERATARWIGLRREIHCASAVNLTSPVLAHDHAAGLLSKAARVRLGILHVVRWSDPLPTWRSGATPGRSARARGRGRRTTLASSAVFTYNRASSWPARTVSSPAADASPRDRWAFKPGTYAYDVTAVTGTSGLEVLGDARA